MSADDVLDYPPQGAADVDDELGAMLADKATKRDAGRLLGVLAALAKRGPQGREENIHLSSTNPPLHLVSAGSCSAFYAYGLRDGSPVLILLGFYKKNMALRWVGTAAARLTFLSSKYASI